MLLVLGQSLCIFDGLSDLQLELERSSSLCVYATLMISQRQHTGMEAGRMETDYYHVYAKTISIFIKSEAKYGIGIDMNVKA